MIDFSHVKALTFDVIGTVVDWRGSIAREAERLGADHGISADWQRFSDTWVDLLWREMDRVYEGARPWTRVDDLHAAVLDEALADLGIEGFTDEQKETLAGIGHRYEPWPDSVYGLTQLKSRFLIVALSNGNMSMLVNGAKHAGLPWDCILSAELAQRMKPDPAVYDLPVRLLDLRPDEMVMVAAHPFDLEGARQFGFKMAFLQRPHEADMTLEEAYESFDLAVDGFEALVQAAVQR